MKRVYRGEVIMENLGIVVGIALGLFGSVFSVYQYRHQKKLDAERDLKERLYFLANIIVDKDIPRKSRQPFYDEYIAKGGNGSFVKFWLEEEPKE
jgi:hypothetical protein